VNVEDETVDGVAARAEAYELVFTESVDADRSFEDVMGSAEGGR
jgi:hypothetical protein